MSAVSREDVLEALRPIVDPDLGRSIVELGFIKNLAIDQGRVRFDIELTTPACPVKEAFEKDARERVGALAGVDAVEVRMTADTRGRRPAGAGSGGEAVLPGVKNVVAVASGKGGVGKSTTAVNLALALQKSGARVGLLDADVYGPSLPLLLGVGGRPETREIEGKKKILPLVARGLRVMSMGFFLNKNSPVIWRGPMVHGLVRQFLNDVEWGELEYLVIDLPPGTGDAALTLTQGAPISGAVIVTTANDLSVIDARRGLTMFEKVNVPVLGIVENMAWFEPPDSPGKRYWIFGKDGGKRVADELGVDFLGEIPIDPRVAEKGDQGEAIVESAPESAAARAFGELAGVVARKLAVLATKSPPIADPNITWLKS